MIPIRHVLVLIRGVIEPLSKTSTGPTVLIWVILSGISAEVRQNSLGISLPALELIMNIFLSILYSFRSLRFTIAFGLFGRSHLLRFESKLPILVIAFEMCCVSKNACVAVGCKSVRAIRQSEGQLVVSQKHRAESWSFLSLLAYMFM